MATKTEDILKHINDRLEGGYAGLQKQTETAVNAAQRPTSKLSTYDPVSDKVSRMEKQRTEREEQAEKQRQEQQEQKVNSVQDILDYLNKSEEEEKKEYAKEGKRRAIEAIGEGLGAIAQIAGAAKGSVSPLYEWNKNGKSLSERGRERYEKLRRERELRREKYINAAKGLYKMQWDKERWQRELDRQMKDAETRAKNADTRIREADIREFTAQTMDEYRKASIEQKREHDKIYRDLADGRISLMKAQELWNKAKAAHEWVKTANDQNGYTEEVTEVEDYSGGKTTSKSRRPNKPVTQGGKKENPMSWQNGKKKNPMS